MKAHDLETRPQAALGLLRQVEEEKEEKPEAQSLISRQYDPLAQLITRTKSQPGVDARTVAARRSVAGGSSGVADTMLRLQRTYGNRYTQGLIARAVDSSEAPEVAPEVEDAIQLARGSGQALDGGARSQMEPAFGADFSGVRVHADAEADMLNRAVNARAFTTGQDIFFREGEYSAGSSGGSELLAHELAHVVQQTGGLQAKLAMSTPGDEYEQEADEMARRVTRHDLGTSSDIAITAGWESAIRSPGPGLPIQRETARSAAAKQADDESRTKVREIEERVGQHDIKITRSEDKVTAIFHFIEFQSEVMKRATSWEQAAIMIGTAYVIAAGKHRKALEDRAKAEALGNQVMFSVLTMATAGGLSWLSTAVQAGKEAALLTNILEDTMQAAAGEAFSAIGTQMAVPVVSPVSMDPQVFQNGLLKRVLKARGSALEYFKAVSKELRTAPPEFWDTYSERRQTAKYEEWLERANQLKGIEVLPSQEEIEDELERGFWAKWVQLSLYKEYYQLRPPDMNFGPAEYEKQVKYSSPGTAVEKEFDRLGITKTSTVGNFGWWTSETEIQKVIDWGRGYKVKEFAP